MRFFRALALVVCARAVCAQTPEDPEVARARIELQRVKSLVQMGALPRGQLAKAEDAVGEAQDRVLLRTPVSAQELTEEKADELAAAADRQFQRKKKAFDDAKKLVDSGLAPEVSLGDMLQDLDFARRQCELV